MVLATNSTYTKVEHTNSIGGSGHKQYMCPSQSASQSCKQRLVYERSRKNKICLEKFVSASNERQSSGDMGTILEYTNVPGPNQSGSSWD